MKVRMVVTGLVVAAALAGVASGAPARSTDAVTLTLAARLQDRVALDAAIARFEQQHPNIAVKPTYYALGTQLTAAVLPALVAGTAPDVLSIGSGGAPTAGIPSVWALAPKYLADLSDRPWVKHVWTPLLPLFSVAGKVYAAPLANSLVSVAYNKALFGQLGIVPPTTWSGLLADCSRIADRGIVPIEMAGADGISVGFLGSAVAANSVYTSNPNWSVERSAGKVTFAGTPGWHAALQSILDMKGARCFQSSPAPATTTAAAAYEAFNAGQAAMMIMSSIDSATNVSQPNPSLDLGFFPLPGASVKSTRVLLNPAVNLTVNASSPVKQQALEFVDFMQRAWQSVAVADAENSIAAIDVAYGYTPQRWSSFKPFIGARQVYVAPLSWANNPTGVAVFRSGMTALLAGTKSIDQVLAEVDAAW